MSKDKATQNVERRYGRYDECLGVKKKKKCIHLDSTHTYTCTVKYRSHAHESIKLCI